MMRFVIATAAVLLISIHAFGTESYLGTAISVIDGDTFRIKTETQNLKVRLCGVDSPGRSKPGFRAATAALADMIRESRFTASRSAKGRRATADPGAGVEIGPSPNAL